MNFSQIIPTEMHAPLRWLGRLGDDWLIIKAGSEKRTTVQINWEFLHSHSDADKWIKGLLLNKFRREMILLCWMDAMASALAKGPKIFAPTAEQFDAMLHVKINLPIGDYRQPYPSMIVKIPSESRDAMAKEVGLDPQQCPNWMLTRTRLTNEGKVMVITGHSFAQLDGTDVTYVFQDRPEFEDVEEALANLVVEEGAAEDKRPNHFGRLSTRACMNLMLMLTHYGCRDAGPLVPKEYESHRKHKNLDHLCHGDFRSVELKQHVVVRRTERGPGHGEEPIPTGRELAPHWRHGHWRNQHWGPGNQYTKLKFINPVFVRPDRVVGDLADTFAAYVGR